MIQDIHPHRFHNEFEPDAVPAPEDYVLHFREDKVLMCRDGERTAFPKVSDFPDAKQLIFLLRIDGKGCYLLQEAEQLPQNTQFIRMMEVREQAPKELAFTALTAWQLANWYRNNVFCGRCGAKTVRSGWERAIVCPKCGNTVYPKIVPAVIVAVVNGEKLLLTRYANRPYSRYALVAGFTEIGETLAETVAREVMEEVGLKVRNITYYKSQPWGIVDDLLAGFYCEVDGDDTIRLDRNELKEGVWLERSEIPTEYDDYSMTNEMIIRFKEGLDPMSNKKCGI